MNLNAITAQKKIFSLFKQQWIQQQLLEIM